MLKEIAQSDMLDELSTFTISSEELKLEKLLSKQGASASVYSGFCKGNQVAVKKFYAFSTEEEKKEILNEAKIMLIGLKSSYLMSLKAICLKPYAMIAMELMPGSLNDLLESGCKLPWSIRYQIACDVSYGLRELHDNGIIHRDLKSLNILLKNYRAKLADFGIAKETGSNIIQTVQKTGGIPKGSWPWMAPELFEKGNTWTKEADIYSLGIVLLELVTRKIPNRNLAIKDGTFSVDHPKIPDDCPKEIEPLLLSFQNEPKKRLQMKDIIEKLECMLAVEQKLSLSSVHVTETEQKTQLSSTLALKTGQKVQSQSLSVIHPESKDKTVIIPVEKEKKYDDIMQEPKNVYENEKKKNDNNPCPITFAGTATPPINPVKPLVTTSNTELKKSVLSAHLSQNSEVLLSSADLNPSTSSPVGTQLLDIQKWKDLELQTPVQPPKSTSPLPLVSQTISQTIVVPPKLTRKPLVDQKMLSQLLRYIAEGEQDEAEKLIQQDKNLLRYAGTITDLSNREFKQITAFQYALWAMDWHMWTMLQKYLPQEAQAQQLEELETKGTAHGENFSLQGLIEALQTYVDNTQKVWHHDQRAKDHWCKVVGGQQKLLPAHVVNEYTRPDRPRESCPDEWKLKLPRTREVAYILNSQWRYTMGSWFIAPSSKYELGKTFAFVRDWCEGNFVLCYGCKTAVPAWERGAGADLRSLQSLWKTRSQQLEALKSQLLSMSSQNQGLKAESKYAKKSLVQPLKSTRPLLPVSQTIAQTIMPPPKPKATPEQLMLQDKLIMACKQGDAKAVGTLLQQGAKPDIANAKGEQPLGAAVWGMCPNAVIALLKQTGGVTSMTWQECEQHNLTHYQEMFIVHKFDPKNYREWYQLLLKMDSSLFIPAFYLRTAKEIDWISEGVTWSYMKESFLSLSCPGAMKVLPLKTPSTFSMLVGGSVWPLMNLLSNRETTEDPNRMEKRFEGFRSQIKQSIKSAIQPTARKTF